MTIILGYDTFAFEVFGDDSASLSTTKYAEFNGSIIDDISIRYSADISMTNEKETWQSDTILLAKFQNSLEAGNIDNSGVKIVNFKILRRDTDQMQDDIYIGEVPYTTNAEYIDSTQPNRKLTYTVVPVGENGLDGVPKEVTISSEFTGIWLVDKDTNELLAFDKAIDSVGNIDTTFNQDRTVIETFSSMPQVYYSPTEYHSFTLSTLLIPSDLEKSGTIYLDVLNKFIKQHKPFIVKTDNGMIYVCDISNIRTSTPLVTWNGYDYMTISVDCLEIMDVKTYLEEA